MSKRLVVGALIIDQEKRPGLVLAARRSTPPVGRWEFPGGKMEVGESPQVALAREIKEELGATVDVRQRLDPPSGGRWPISELLEMELWWCMTRDEPQPGDSHDELRWFAAAELGSVEWLPADRDALTQVAGGLV